MPVAGFFAPTASRFATGWNALLLWGRLFQPIPAGCKRFD